MYACIIFVTISMPGVFYLWNNSGYMNWGITVTWKWLVERLHMMSYFKCYFIWTKEQEWKHGNCYRGGSRGGSVEPPKLNVKTFKKLVLKKKREPTQLINISESNNIKPLQIAPENPGNHISKALKLKICGWQNWKS